MREAGGPAEAGTFTAALRCVHVLVYSQNNAIDGDLRSRFGKLVTACRSARTLNEPGTAQSAKDLLEIRERNLLAFRNLRNRHRRIAFTSTHGDVDHGGNGKTAFSRQLQLRLPSNRWLTILAREAGQPLNPDCSCQFCERILRQQS